MRKTLDRRTVAERGILCGLLKSGKTRKEEKNSSNRDDTFTLEARSGAAVVMMSASRGLRVGYGATIQQGPNTSLQPQRPTCRFCIYSAKMYETHYVLVFDCFRATPCIPLAVMEFGFHDQSTPFPDHQPRPSTVIASRYHLTIPS